MGCNYIYGLKNYLKNIGYVVAVLNILDGSSSLEAGFTSSGVVGSRGEWTVNFFIP